MPDHAPSAAGADADARAGSRPGTSSGGRPPVTPTTPNSPFTGSFHARPSPTRSFNLHALGFNTSPLGPLSRGLSFYGGDSDSGSGSGDDNDALDNGNDHIEGYSNDGSSLNDGLNRNWQTSDDGLDDPIALEERKDVLIDRLNDVVRHVSSYAPSSPSFSNRSNSTWNSPGKSAPAPAEARSGPADDGTVLSALHAHIDEMEAVLAAAQAAEAAAAAASPRNHRHHHHHHHRHYPWQRPERRSRASTSSLADDKSPGQKSKKHARRTTLDAAPILFRAQSSFRGAEQAAAAPASASEVNKADTMVTSAVAVDCEVLAGDLSAVLDNLLKRRQESEMIQEALLQKLAAANNRTAELEAQVQALTAAKADTDNNNEEIAPDDDDEGTTTETATEKAADDDTVDPVLVDRLADLDDLGSELSFLRLQLRGIEVRCRSYVPADADPELTESIENWKADWSALRAKVDEERRSTTTSINTSMSMSMGLLGKDGGHSYTNSMSDMNSTF